MHDATKPGQQNRSGEVEFRGISKKYGGVAVVDGIDLKIEAGEFVSLLGPSGSGKTTLLMLLAGFIEPSAGSIFVDGKRLDQVPPNRRNQGIVFQSYALFPNMTAYENVAFPLKARGIGESRARDLVGIALQRVRMAGYANRFPSQLSGGQQQRIALARAIVFDPPLVLMDESLSALDRKLRQEMRVEIKDLHRELGKTIIYVTHDQEEALTMSDRVVVLQAGRIAQAAHPLEVYENPCNAYVAGFVGDANFLDGAVERSEGRHVDIAALGGRVRACVDTPWRDGQQVRVLVRPEAILLEPAGVQGQGGGRTGIAGVVTQVAFLGDAHQYHIEAGGHSLVAKVARSRTSRHFSSGDSVDVGFHAEDVRVFPIDA